MSAGICRNLGENSRGLGTFTSSDGIFSRGKKKSMTKSGFVKMISHVVDMQPTYSNFYKLFKMVLPNLIAIKRINTFYRIVPFFRCCSSVFTIFEAMLSVSLDWCCVTQVSSFYILPLR